jgi:hypothetical protein
LSRTSPSDRLSCIDSARRRVNARWSGPAATATATTAAGTGMEAWISPGSRARQDRVDLAESFRLREKSRRAQPLFQGGRHQRDHQLVGAAAPGEVIEVTLHGMRLTDGRVLHHVQDLTSGA